MSLEIDQVENAYGEAVATGKHGDAFLAALTESLNRALRATPPASAERDALIAVWEAATQLLDKLSEDPGPWWWQPEADYLRDALRAAEARDGS